MNNELIDRTPPQDNDAEQSVLGSVFLSRDALVEAMAYVTADDFYKKAHQYIFAAMVALTDRDEAIDIVTLKNELATRQQLADVGGITYLVDLANIVPTAANVVYYAKIVKQKATLRKLIDTATHIVQTGYNPDSDVEDVLDNAEKEIMAVSDTTQQNGFKPISDVLNDALTKVTELSKNNDEITGLSTGYRDLDLITAGLHEDELIILCPARGRKDRVCLECRPKRGHQVGHFRRYFQFGNGGRTAGQPDALCGRQYRGQPLADRPTDR